MELLRNYTDARRALLDYFGYPLNSPYPIEDCTSFYWWTIPNYSDEVQFAPDCPESIRNDGKYTETIKRQYTGSEFTLIECWDSHTGGCMLLIFDNNKRKEHD